MILPGLIPFLVEEWGGGVDDNVSPREHILLPSEITDYTVDTYDIHERTAHFMEHRPIAASNRIAVEAVYMVEALMIVKSMNEDNAEARDCTACAG